MKMSIARATPGDTREVLDLLNSAAGWLKRRGLDQWPNGFTMERIQPYVTRGEVWLVRESEGRALVTVRANADADPDFWTPAEASELALYLSKLAIARDLAGQGIGELLVRWISDYAAQLGYQWLRLDAWRTNRNLHEYYRRNGWDYLRTVDAPGRRSGALFQRPAVHDEAARSAFTSRPQCPGWLEPGARVNVTKGRVRGGGIITSIYAPYDRGLVSTTGEYGVLPLPAYWVQLDDQAQPILCRPGELEALPDTSG